ncbi:MAG TPA: DbpA RNA binding domain-containing protein [Bacteroidales bacterium]|nr:DbpA RNA binding domain-containing protein [Bacteroidales bacterium]
MNFGVKDRITKSTIVRLVCDEAHISNRELGTIDIKREFSFFEVEEGQAGNVYSSLQQAKLDGRKVVVEPAEKNDDTGDRKRKKKKRKQVKNFA